MPHPHYFSNFRRWDAYRGTKRLAIHAINLAILSIKGIQYKEYNFNKMIL